MAVYKNAEIRLGGHLIRVNVEVDSSVPITGPAAGTVEWGGVLRPPNNTGLVPGEIYLLVIPALSPAKIEITSEANAADGSVTFKGIGDFPANARTPQIQNAR